MWDDATNMPGSVVWWIFLLLGGFVYAFCGCCSQGVFFFSENSTLRILNIVIL